MSSSINNIDSNKNKYPSVHKSRVQVVQSHPLLQNNDNDDNDGDINNNPNESPTRLQQTSTTTISQLVKPIVPPRNKLKTIANKIMSDNNQAQAKEECVKINAKPVQSEITDDSNRLQANCVRWLYKDDIAAPKWLTFNGEESLRLEIEYQKQTNNKVQVLNGLYEAVISDRKCIPIYWDGSPYLIMRGTWFYDQTWEPLDEDISDRIELEHINKFKDILKSTNNDTNKNKENETNKTLTNEEMSVISSNTTNSSEMTSPASSEDLNKNVNTKITKTQTEPVYTITVKDSNCYWYAADDVYFSKNKTFMKSLGLTFGKQKYGSKIMRGYKTLADTEEKVLEINHLVFVIHGIAQKLYEKSIIKSCDDVRKNCETMKAKFLSNLPKTTRCEFLPVDWRSSLTLDAGIVESITPQTIKYIRTKLNSSALDIMYYTSPLFRHEIMSGLCTEINRLYNLFCEKNPNFKANGKISVVAHSLGSVIFYDILTSNNSYIQLTNAYGEDIAQETKMLNHFSHGDKKLMDEYYDAKKKILEIESSLCKSNESISQLDFKLENYFCLGSPLAVFLALRGVRPSGNGLQDHILPKTLCKNLFNVFHPCDAVAYRLEPLILKHYSTLMPVEIHRSSDSSSTKHIPYKEMKNKALKAEVELGSSVKDVPTSMSFSFLKSKKNTDSANSSNELLNQESTPTNEVQTTIFNTIANLMQSTPVSNPRVSIGDSFDQVDLEKRFDYQLATTSNFELISALTSHTSYWTSLDVALFIITQLTIEN